MTEAMAAAIYVQGVQKRKYDAKRAEMVGERVMHGLYPVRSTQGQDRKLSRPFHGPYRVLALDR